MAVRLGFMSIATGGVDFLPEFFSNDSLMGILNDSPLVFRVPPNRMT
jgi:hypothetical protein